MIKFSKILKIYIPFTKARLQELSSYKINFFMIIIGDILKILITYYLWKTIFDSSSDQYLNGFTLNTMTIYIFISSITSKIVSNKIDLFIGTEVKDGSIATYLIKPINYNIRLLFNSLGTCIYNTIFICIPIFIVLIIFQYIGLGQNPPSIGILLIYIISVMLSFIIMFLFNSCFGLFSFYTVGMWGLNNLKIAIVKFFSGELIPLTFFPGIIRKFIEITPFSSIVYTPTMIYLNKINGYDLVYALSNQLIWISVLLLVNVVVWKISINKLTIMGG